ncbi:MAG: hypothetical protein AAF502_16095 [Bacteroidota bacterium]
MIDNILMTVLLLASVCAGFLLISALPKVVWSWSPLFFKLNYFQWLLHNPLRRYLRNNRSPYPRIIYLTNLPFYAIWWCAAYILLFPIRVINSLYFNILLFISTHLRDCYADLVYPQTKGFRFLKGKKYHEKWILNFPVRLFNLIVRNIKVIFQSIAMFLFDLIWPSLTLYHGTEFRTASVPITQSGSWRIGREDFVGTGVYFAIDPKVAMHYAGTVNPSLIVARVTLTMLRPVSTLNEKIRKKAGSGGSGDLISGNAGLLTGTLEHWRHDRGGWYEFCVIFPGQKDKYIRTWRIRPICVLPLDKRNGVTHDPERIWDGMAFWPMGKVAVTIFLITVGLLTAGIFTATNQSEIFPRLFGFLN